MNDVQWEEKDALTAESARWDTTRCAVGTGAVEDVDKLTKLLSDGWEPFAVTASGLGDYVYHFRRPAHSDGSGSESH